MRRQTRGRLPALLGAGVLLLAAGQALAQADVRRGEKLFVECKACHALGPTTDANALGPSLAGLFGRKAASVEDFRFSPAMRRSNLAWNRQTLDAFLADPQAFMPGNRMPYSGLADAKERADLIAYLSQATAAAK
ncbi:MAG: c-type cytochrome [Burkholderiales bacterium]|nr:c-type cytochrome [Burkholderiales bacterium]